MKVWAGGLSIRILNECVCHGGFAIRLFLYLVCVCFGKNICDICIAIITHINILIVVMCILYILISLIQKSQLLYTSQLLVNSCNFWIKDINMCDIHMATISK